MSSRENEKKACSAARKSQKRPYDSRPRSGPGPGETAHAEQDGNRPRDPARPNRRPSTRRQHGCCSGFSSRPTTSSPTTTIRKETPSDQVRVLRPGVHRGPARPRVVARPGSSPAPARSSRRADGVIVTEFFDVDKSRSIPWQRRPQATALLAELKNPNREFDAVVIGEPHRAFYGNQYGLTFPLFEHYGVPLWVPEVGGPIDPRNEAHDLVMSRVRRDEQGRAEPDQDPRQGRHGRPGQGRGPVPRRAPALRVPDRRRRTAPQPGQGRGRQAAAPLDLDPEAAPVVRRIFAEFIAGHGFYAIAEGLTRDGIPSPSAHDPERNKHRCGHRVEQVRRPRDPHQPPLHRPPGVEQAAQGRGAHRRRRRRARPHHQAPLERDRQVAVVGEDRPPADHRPRRPSTRCRPWSRARATRPPSTSRTARGTRTRCAAASGAASASGGCKATGPTTCRTTAAASPPSTRSPTTSQHPLNVYLREDQLIGEVDRWLAREFAPHRLHETIRDLAAAQLAEPPARPRRPRGNRAQDRRVRPQASPVPRRARRGGEPGHGRRVDRRDRSREGRIPGRAGARAGATRRRMSEAEIKAIVDRLADLARVLADADPNDKSEIFRQLGLRLTYHPGRGLVEAQVMPAECGFFESVRGGT